MSTFSLVIPVKNGGPRFTRVLDALALQTRRPADLLVIDSGSTDGSAVAAARAGARVVHIPPREFDHGGTRNLGMRLSREGTVVYLTQDALPADRHALERLVAPLGGRAPGGGRITVAYGRQMAGQGASPFAAFLREFNYPPRGGVRILADRERLGLRAAFCSNSFAAWDRSALEAVGGFPEHLLFGEDACTVAAMLRAGMAVAYVADARVLHWHEYSLAGEFRRYFDVGAFHAMRPDLPRDFGSPGGAGRAYVLQEMAWLRARGLFWRIPEALLRNALKYLGYRLGRLGPRLPVAVAARCSMQPGWWRARRANALPVPGRATNGKAER